MVPTGFSLWDYRCDYVGNHDGDSVTLTIDQGFGNSKVTQDGLRLKDTYAPEMSEVGGVETRDFVTRWFNDHVTWALVTNVLTLWPFMVRTEMTAKGTRERVTFGRFIGVVWVPGDPVSLNDAVNAYVSEKGYPRGTGYKAASGSALPNVLG